MLSSRRLHSLGRDTRGGVAMLVGLAMLPLVGLTGLAIDSYRSLSYQSQLNAATDAGAMAAISAARNYVTSHPLEIDPSANAIAAGKSAGALAFNANLGFAAGQISVVPSVDVTRSGSTYNSTVGYASLVPLAFGKLFGVRTWPLAGQAKSSVTIGKYLDFYILLDTSGSMGLPTSTDGQDKLAAFNRNSRDARGQPNGDNISIYPNGCVFACHFPGNLGYDYTRTPNPTDPTKPLIELRADSVGYAVQQLLTTAQNTQTLAGQFRVGLYPFIVKSMAAFPLHLAGIDPVSPVSSDLAAASLVAGNLAAFLDYGGTNSDWGSGGTHFDNAFAKMNSVIKTIGDGSSPAAPQPFLFVVTDGINNSQTYPFTGSVPQLINSSVCNSLKAKGVTVSVLYTPYLPIKNPVASFAGDEDGKVNALIPSVPATLQACASSGFFFTANTPADISSAMQAMFKQALLAARLTQ